MFQLFTFIQSTPSDWIKDGIVITRESLKAIKPVYTAYRVYLYLLFRLRVLAATWRDWLDRRAGDPVPLPPAILRYRVHGGLDKESFLQVGERLAQNIRDLLAGVGCEIGDFEHILDFGCGCGRVIRNFQDTPETCHFYGTDIDPELVGWCQKHLHTVQWSTNGYQPPLTYADGAFDLIYAISVFTHLDEQLQHLWLRELERIARPGAILILSVHGESTVGGLNHSDLEVFHACGFLYLVGARGILKLDGLPDFYQTAYHTQAYVERVWSGYFEILSYVERGIDNFQDAVVMRKR